MKEQILKEIIDAYLTKWVDIGLNKLPINIETEMTNPSQDGDSKWQSWYPVDSKVTDDEINEIENRIGYNLPYDYKIFLKHKHFYEFQIGEVLFCSHPVYSWRESLSKIIFDGYPTRFLIEKGYIPFANWSDWGVLCFDATRNLSDRNYPIVLWDHENANEVQDQYINFYDMLTKLDNEVKGNTL
jgi:SMI1-KNR4 cell-wall